MAELFLGFVQSVGKAPIHKYVGKEDTWLSEPPLEGDYCGILNPMYIQLDFDTEEDSKIALEIVERYKIRCDILKTSRGIHLYMLDDGSIKSQSVNIFNTIGLRVDIGLGKKNRVVPLRTTKIEDRTKMVNGKEEIEQVSVTTTREWLQTYDLLDEIPPYFKPMGTRDFGLKTTETRNQTLFTYILQLQMKGFTRTEIRKIIKIINDFILYEPLSDLEIDTITRDDAFSEQLFFVDFFTIDLETICCPMLIL